MVFLSRFSSGKLYWHTLYAHKSVSAPRGVNAVTPCKIKGYTVHCTVTDPVMTQYASPVAGAPLFDAMWYYTSCVICGRCTFVWRNVVLYKLCHLWQVHLCLTQCGIIQVVSSVAGAPLFDAMWYYTSCVICGRCTFVWRSVLYHTSDLPTCTCCLCM